MMGSPPRVREPLDILEDREVSVGITPACAGTTVGSTRSNSMMRDHPRVCGNHLSSNHLLPAYAGSPPRVREPPPPAADVAAAARITPACAGTTTTETKDNPNYEDHPRVCGNHSNQ